MSEEHKEPKTKNKVVIWQLATAVLAILLVISIITGGSNSGSGAVVKETNQPTQKTEGYTEADLAKLKEFSQCLADNGIKIYGANWCGWTKKLAVETLGGFDVAGDAYIECTENKELCTSEGIQGYPTIKLNGEPYKGKRTLESLGSETGCTVPDLKGSAASSGKASTCGG